MAMTPDQIKDLLTTIVSDVNMAADFAGILDPELIPFIAIGKAVDKVVPGIASSVASMIQGTPPTQDQIAQNAQELAMLGDKGGI